MAAPGPDRSTMPAPARVALLALYLGAGLFWAVLNPPFKGVDETTHVDAVRHIRMDSSVPRWGVPYDRSSLEGGASVRALMGDDGRFDLPVPDRADRPAFGPPRGPMPAFRDNQMFQHPPLPYVAQAALLVGADTVVDVEAMPADRVVGLLRLANVLVLAPLPLLLAGTVRHLGGGRPAQLVAAVLPLGVPQLWHLAGAVGNDSWMVLGAAAVTYGFARIVAGEARFRSAVWFGGVLGLALLTKAFALALVVLPVLAYGQLAGRRCLSWPAAGLRLLTTGALALAVGGWWWVWNVVQYGTVQPQGSPVAGLEPPPGFEPLGAEWGVTFASWMVTRYWGWFGAFDGGLRLPLGVVAAATVIGVAAVAAGLVWGTRQQRWFGLSAVAVHLLVLVGVARAARSLHVDNGVLQGIQGRYLFVALPALVATAAIGADALAARVVAGARRVVPAAAVGAVAVMQAVAVTVVLDGWWGAPPGDRVAAVRSLGAWQPWPPALLVGSLAVLAATAGGATAATWGRVGTTSRAGDRRGGHVGAPARTTPVTAGRSLARIHREAR